MIDIVTPTHANIDREFVDEAIKAHLHNYTPIKRHMINSIHVSVDGGFVKFSRLNEEPELGHIPVPQPQNCSGEYTPTNKGSAQSAKPDSAHT